MMQTQAAASSIEQFFGTLDTSTTMAAVRQALRDPTGNTSLSLALLAAVVLAVLLLVVFAFMFVTPANKKVVKVRRYAGPRPAGASDPPPGAARVVAAPARKPPSKLFMALTSTAAITALVVLGLIGTYLATSTDAYCAKTCHVSSSASKTGLDIDHATCVSCHEMRGVLAVFANTSDRARMLWAYGIGRSPNRASVGVNSYSCLRCHEDVRSDEVTSAAGVRMSHAEVIEGGRACTECHASTGHVVKEYTATMSTCLQCHDTRTASAECDTCHAEDPGAASVAAAETKGTLGTGRIVYPAVRAANRNCGGCHDQAKECDYCHGLRMPHSNDFIEGGHAVAAAFNRKVVCWQCHDPQSCSTGCHKGAMDPAGVFTGHGYGWQGEHQDASWNSGCVCHSGTGHTQPMCMLCHAPDHSVLPVTQ